MSNWLREAVSKKKRRYRQDGFDLDLTYITDRIIAMGFPASGNEKYFRNPIDDIVKFYEHYHADNYKLYNLCAEREYDYSKFHNRVSRYPFYDHNAPSVQLIKDCCNDLDTYLKENEKHIVGINCKAGKGRTGLIICCYLLFSGKCANTDAALKYYGERRTKDGKGVTIASQQRYIRYYERVLKEFKGEIPRPHKFVLKKLTIKGVPKISGKQFITIEIDNKETFRSKPTDVEDKDDTYDLPVGAPVKGDVKIQLLANKKTFLCHFWFNTGFIDAKELKVSLDKPTIDVANKDRKCKVFKENFSITAVFEIYEGPETESDKEDKKKDMEAKDSGKLKDGNEKPKNGDKGKGKEGKNGKGKTDSKDTSQDENDKEGGKKKGGESKSTPSGSSEEKKDGGEHKDPSFYNYEDYNELKEQGVEISSTSSSQYASSSGEGAGSSSSSEEKPKKKPVTTTDSPKEARKEAAKGTDSPKVSTKVTDSPKTGKRDSSAKDPMAKQNSKSDVKKDMVKQDSKSDVKKKDDKKEGEKPKEEKPKEEKKDEKSKGTPKGTPKADRKDKDEKKEEKPKDEVKDEKAKEEKLKEEKKDDKIKGTPKPDRKDKDEKSNDKDEKKDAKVKDDKEEKKERSKEPVKKEKSKAESKGEVKK